METTTPCAALRTPGNEEIPSLLAELAATGGNLAAFARDRGLSSWKLYKARRKLRRAAPAAPDLVPVRIVDTAEAPTPPSPSIEVEHSCGHRLKVPVGFDAATLLRLVKVLESC
jgi:transposase-like protein